MSIATRIAALSEALQFSLANVPNLVSPITVRKDIRYGNGPRHTLDVHILSKSENRPIVIFWYGGSWTSGSKALYRFVGSALARSGYCAVLPDYRLYPSVVFPKFVEDAAQAVAYVRDNAREWGGNPSKLIVMGHSAGAHLAAMVAYNRRYLQALGGTTRWISALVGLAGPYSLLPNTDTFRAMFHSPYAPADWQPLQHVDRDSPPALLLHGQRDQWLSCTEAIRMRDALAGQGVVAEAEVFPSVTHEDIVAAFSPLARHRAPTLERCIHFIDRILRGPRGTGQ